MEQLHKYTSYATIALAIVTICALAYGVIDRPFNRLGEEIEAVDDKIQAVDGKLTSLSEQVTLVRVGIAGVQGAMPHIDQRITNLESRGP